MRIRALLPKKKATKTVLFQASIDVALLKRARKQRDKDKITWRDLVEASFRRYLAESEGKR